MMVATHRQTTHPVLSLWYGDCEQLAEYMLEVDECYYKHFIDTGLIQALQWMEFVGDNEALSSEDVWLGDTRRADMQRIDTGPIR